MAAEIAVWPVHLGSEGEPAGSIYRSLIERGTDEEPPELGNFVRDLSSAFVDANPSLAGREHPGFPGVVRRTGEIVRLAVPWDRVAEIGELVDMLARRHSLQVFVPDAELLGSDPETPDWETLQSQAALGIQQAWEVGHQRSSTDDPQ